MKSLGFSMSKKNIALPAPAGGLALSHWFEARKGQQNGRRTLGPVSSLENHLSSDWWRTSFNSLYLKTDGDVFENDRNTVEEVDLLIRSTGLEQNDRILDLAVGKGDMRLNWRTAVFNTL